MNDPSHFRVVLARMALTACASSALSACGSARPSQAPLSASEAHAMQRTRPSSARAVEPGSDDHPSVESEAPPPGDDDDDGDDDSGGSSTKASTDGKGTSNLLSR